MSKKNKVIVNRMGSTIKIEIRNEIYRKEYTGTFSLNNKKDLVKILGVLEKYGGVTIAELIGTSWI